jgi:hypothetical protein
MRTVEQLRSDFVLYTGEMQRCEEAKCYWALLYLLLAIPDVCASLESDPDAEVGDRYVGWCQRYLPPTSTVSGADRFQMRNALLHAGSTTPVNKGKKHHTSYSHFSYVDPETIGETIHFSVDPGANVLNVHVLAMASETRHALEKWFSALQTDTVRMARVEGAIQRLTRIQPKIVQTKNPDGSTSQTICATSSSS